MGIGIIKQIVKLIKEIMNKKSIVENLSITLLHRKVLRLAHSPWRDFAEKEFCKKLCMISSLQIIPNSICKNLLALL